MIVTRIEIRCEENAAGKVEYKLALRATKAARATVREMEYMEFAVLAASRSIKAGDRGLQRQARTLPACTRLTGGAA